MKMRDLSTIIWATLLPLAACAPFTATVPPGFAKYRGAADFRAVSHDRVVYSVRHVRNKPRAGFDFWREALPNKMRDAGYRIVADTVAVLHDRKALFLEMVAPLGDYDYSYLVMMTVARKKIVVAEAAGPVDTFQKRKESILDALRSISLQ